MWKLEDLEVLVSMSSGPFATCKCIRAKTIA